MPTEPQTPQPAPVFDFDAYPPETCFHDRREGRDRRTPGPADAKTGQERRSKVERRRHVDPTTFERQYTPEELDFMNAMQAFKIRSGRPFPTYSEVLEIARGLGYRKCRQGFEIDVTSKN